MHFPILTASLALLATTTLSAPLEARTRNSRGVLHRDPTHGRDLVCNQDVPPFSVSSDSLAPPFLSGQLLICELEHPEISVSKITLLGAGQCTIDGVDSSRTTVTTGQTVDVGPPQVQVSGTCYA